MNLIQLKKLTPNKKAFKGVFMTKEEFEKIKNGAQEYAWAIVWNARNTNKDRSELYFKEEKEAMKEYTNILMNSHLDCYEFNFAMAYAYEYAKRYMQNLEASDILCKCDKDLANILGVD